MAQCTATSKQSGKRCNRHATPGYTVCAMHGGKTPRGPHSPHYVHGRYSKVLPKNIAARYEQALQDPELLALRDEIALLDTRAGQLVARLDNGDLARNWLALRDHFRDLVTAYQHDNTRGLEAALRQMGQIIEAGATDHETWDQIVALMDERRKLAEAERKRLVDFNQVLTAEQVKVLVDTLTHIILTEVKDRDTAMRIQVQLNTLLLARQVLPDKASAPESVDDMVDVFRAVSEWERDEVPA